MMCKALSQPLALVIIVAVVVVVAVVGVNYMTTAVDKGMSMAAQLRFYPDSYYNYSNGTLVLHLESMIKPRLIIYKLVLGSIELTDLGTKCTLNIVRGYGTIYSDMVVITPGTEFFLICDVEAPYPGNYIDVAIYTKSGMLFRYQVSSYG